MSKPISFKFQDEVIIGEFEIFSTQILSQSLGYRRSPAAASGDLFAQPLKLTFKGEEHVQKTQLVDSVTQDLKERSYFLSRCGFLFSNFDQAKLYVPSAAQFCERS